MQPPKASLVKQDNSRRTPACIVDRARKVLGAIDLDPASDLEANETIRAAEIIALPQNGLLLPWHGRVFLNPPGGKLDVRTLEPVRGGWKNVVSSVACWWSKLDYEYCQGNVTEAIYVGFTLEAFVNSQRFAKHPIQHYSFCVPSERIEYPASADATSGNAFGGSVIAYLGPNPTVFEKQFSDLGYCRV